MHRKERCMLEKTIDHLLRHRRMHISWMAVVTIFSAFVVTGLTLDGKVIFKGLKVDNSMDVWFADDSPEWRRYKDFQKQFGNDEFVIIAFEKEDIFTRDVLQKIDDLTRELKKNPFISEVTSLTNIEQITGESGTLSFSTLIPQIPGNPSELMGLKAAALANPLYRGNVISSDGRTTGIIIRVYEQPDGINMQRELTDQIYALLKKESEGGKYQFYISGSVINTGENDRNTSNDSILLYLLSFAFMVIVLYLIHRRAIYVIISLTIITIANIWIHGLIVLAGSTYNALMSILTSLVMVIGIADSVHIIASYKNHLQKTPHAPEAARRAFCEMAIPCTFTSLTTAAAFLCLLITNLKVLREFGLYAAIAMLLALLANLFLVPIWLSYLNENRARVTRQKPDNSVIQGIMCWAAGINQKHVKINVVLAFIVFFVSFTGIVKIETNSNDLLNYRKAHPFRVSTEFIEDKLTGILALDIVLTGQADSFKDPEVLKKMDRLEQYIGSLPSVQKTFSMVDYIKEMHKMIQDGSDSYYRIPDTQNLVAQLLFLGEDSNELSDHVDISDYSVARINGRLAWLDNNELKAVHDRINQKARTLFAPLGIQAEVSGLIPIYLNWCDYLIESQVKGFSLSLFAIFLMFALLVRSFKLSLIAMIPNVIPIFLTLGIMGWAHIYLDKSTIIYTSLAIGLAVDNTIHFIARLRNLFAQHGNYEIAIRETLTSVGVPITITTIVLFCGFIIFLVHSFMPSVYFGILMAITMVAALIATLFVLPALIKILKPLGAEKMEAAMFEEGPSPTTLVQNKI